jgi:hypothetical protein
MNNSKNLANAIKQAIEDCDFWRHEFVTPEHVLYAFASQEQFASASELLPHDASWLITQLEDLKFTIYRASFDTTSDTVVTLGSTAPQFKAAPFNAFDTISGSNQIKLRLRGHGLKTGDNFSVEGAVGGNGLTDAEFNGVKTVVDYDINGVTFTASTNATATGTVGGDNIIVNGNTPFTEFISSIRALNYGESTIKWEMNYLTTSRQ